MEYVTLISAVIFTLMAGTKSVPDNAIYCGTKHFVRAMLDSFHSECVMEGTNIRTTTIYPGVIKTELLNTVAESKMKDMVSKFYENIGLTLIRLPMPFCMP
ncbi:MAG: SDR family NAD(P)-dependent oxidoreductase [Clostridia bacterium]|nr:SDR family NAD(P)-dependent oxidoreductase [Clostridia bacterium]